MHQLAVAEMIKSVRRRMKQGDCPTEAPFGREQLENALVTLADMYERVAPGRLQGLPDAAVMRQRIAMDRDVDTEAGLPMPLRDNPSAAAFGVVAVASGETKEEAQAHARRQLAALDAQRADLLVIIGELEATPRAPTARSERDLITPTQVGNCPSCGAMGIEDLVCTTCGNARCVAPPRG